MTPTSIITKLLIAIAVIAGISWTSIHFTQAAATREIMAAQKATREAEAKVVVLGQAKAKADQKVVDLQQQAGEWKGKAEAAGKLVAARENDVKALQAKLAKLKPLPAVTNPGSTPTEQIPLAAAYTSAGFPPTLIPNGDLGFSIGTARPMLAIIQDGMAYPSALDRVAVLNDTVSVLTEQKTQLLVEVDATQNQAALAARATQAAQEAEAACEGQVVALQGAVEDQRAVVAATEKLITAESRKKILWGGAGVALGWLLKVALLAL